MARAWRKWPGVVLALVWMTARLVLPLQAHCPHHAAATAVAAVANGSSTVSEGGHAAQHQGHDVSGVLHDASPAPHESAPVPCECAAHCCAASVVAIGAPAVSSVPLAPLLQRTVHALELASLPLREFTQTRQPPATAPPHDSTLG